MATVKDLGRARRGSLREVQRDAREVCKHMNSLASYLQVQLRRGQKFIPTDDTLMQAISRYQSAVTASRSLTKSIDAAADLFG